MCMCMCASFEVLPACSAEGIVPEETRLVLPSLTLLPPLKRAAVWGERYLCMSCVWEVSLIRM